MFPLCPNYRGELHPVKRPTGPLLSFWVGVVLLKVTFFGLATAVQHNDPDPHLWIPAYAIPSILSFHLALRLLTSSHGDDKPLKDNPLWMEKLIQLHLLYCFLLGGYTLFLSGEEQLEDDMMLEVGKELVGLCILILWLVLLSNLNLFRIPVRVGVVAGAFLSLAPILSWFFVHFYHHC